MARISKKLDEEIRRQAGNRCGYCRSPQNLIPYKLEIEHLLPKDLGGQTERDNLWLACRECNAHKSKKNEALDTLTGKVVELFNPRKHLWSDHFEFGNDPTQIVGRTACGRATVENLQFNNAYQTSARSAWIDARRFPPAD